jgi:hypothetical protein
MSNMSEVWNTIRIDINGESRIRAYLIRRWLN